MHHAPSSSTTMSRHPGPHSPSVMSDVMSDSQLAFDRCTRPALEVPVRENGVVEGSLSVRRLRLASLERANPYLPVTLLTRSNALALLS